VVAVVGDVVMAQTLHADVHAPTEQRGRCDITWLSSQQSKWCAQWCFYSWKNARRIASRL